jgi:hypothetical protein
VALSVCSRLIGDGTPKFPGFNGETTFNELSSILYVFTENENTLVVSGLIDYLNDFSTEKQRN